MVGAISIVNRPLAALAHASVPQFAEARYEYHIDCKVPSLSLSVQNKLYKGNFSETAGQKSSLIVKYKLGQSDKGDPTV